MTHAREKGSVASVSPITSNPKSYTAAASLQMQKPPMTALLGILRGLFRLERCDTRDDAAANLLMVCQDQPSGRDDWI